jgi:hypothetical protein
MLDDAKIIAEAIRLSNEGFEVVFPVKGKSMRPFIVGDQNSVCLTKPQNLKCGDVVLALIENNHHVIHRIVKMNENHITLMGDGNLYQTEHCLLENVEAKISAVVKANGKRFDITAPWRIAVSKAWRKMHRGYAMLGKIKRRFKR